MHHLEYDDLSVRRSLAVAHDALAASGREADRDAALVLRGIGALDLPAYGAPLLARLVGIDARRAEAALDRLVDVALLEETAYGRYAPHDLVRDFARELATPTSHRRRRLRPAPGTQPPPNSPSPRSSNRASTWTTAAARPRPSRPDHAAQVAALPDFAILRQAFAWGDIGAGEHRHAGRAARG